MNLIDPIIEEFNHEMATTRKLLERVPEEHFAWKPHPKSMSLAELASHITDSISWTGVLLGQDELVFDPEEYKPYRASSRADLLKTFDANVGQAGEQMKGQQNERLMTTWRMKSGDQVVFEMPRIAALRGFIISHTIHHRGQLDVYLRLKDVPLPQIYGPSADEPGMMA